MLEGALSVANRVDSFIAVVCRIVIVASGILLTAIMTANVIVRYMSDSGGFDFAEELPTMLFPWFIVAGITLAAQSGAHMAVEWIYDKFDERGKVAVLLFANLVTVASFIILADQALVVAEIAGAEISPVLQLPNSIGYYSIAFGAAFVSAATAAASLRILAGGWHARPHGGNEEMPL